MAGTSTTTGPRIRARAARLAAIGVLAGLSVVVSPGTATAAPGGGTVRGIVDCYTINQDGTFDVVVGYVSTYPHTVEIRHGERNDFRPARLQGAPPQQFDRGTVHGAFTVTMAAREIGPQAVWSLDGNTLEFGAQGALATRTCPPTTVLPADGNGTGTAVALAGAGVFGAAVLYRFRRRLARLADGGAPTHA